MPSPISNPGGRRLHHFDMLKGIAIAMVVMGHVLTMCIRDIDSAVAFKIISNTHMPVFFFISGYMSGRRSDSLAAAAGSIAKRFKQLVVPMVVVSTIWIFYFPHSGLQSPFDSSFEGLWSNSWKNGYWFTLTLFAIIVIWTFVARIGGLFKPAMTAAIVWAALIAMALYLPVGIVGYAGLDLLARFWPIFCIGALARRGDWLERCLSSDVAVTVCIAALCPLYYYALWPWEFDGVSHCAAELLYTLLYFAISIVALAVVRPWAVSAFADGVGSAAARLWCFLGRKSLAIYLFHFFFLFPLAALKEPLEAVNLAFVPTIAIAAIIAAAIIAAVLLVNAIISKSNILARLLTGQISK